MGRMFGVLLGEGVVSEKDIGNVSGGGVLEGGRVLAEECAVQCNWRTVCLSGAAGMSAPPLPPHPPHSHPAPHPPLPLHCGHRCSHCCHGNCDRSVHPSSRR